MHSVTLCRLWHCSECDPAQSTTLCRFWLCKEWDPVHRLQMDRGHKKKETESYIWNKISVSYNWNWILWISIRFSLRLNQIFHINMVKLVNNCIWPLKTISRAYLINFTTYVHKYLDWRHFYKWMNEFISANNHKN